ncbi:multicopper oxidase domain-containing protein [Lactobacillus alvi]|uniref:Multicopper oxidase domain-containing protein n=1 Tax=Limosilactobacillus alvi TaxID=990412 RepID=A0ABS2EMW5_9LACO|nr:multicopper oxidase domain-containing protein [Limosilactobacillus alvi]MBM6753763.1 multicopper oxidase domain-containing protein [Limosilactobacillus alvi]
MTTIDHYFYDESAYDYHDGGYVPLKVADAPTKPLTIPPLLKPDKQTANETWYTLTAQAGETQLLPGEKTKTWGYNGSLLGPIVHYERGKTYHLHLVNHLPELTTFHWHGLAIPGPIEDGGCHAPVYPGQSRDVSFKINQPAAFTWLHAHPCPETAAQVWHGLATGAIVTDQHEAKLPLPRNYGVDDIPLILQDRRFHENNQWDYRADYDPDGVAGPTPMINGTINPYFDVTTQKLRLRFLNGANRREWRLHFDDNRIMTQIAGDLSLLPQPIKLTKLMLTCAERAEVIVDFGDCKPGDVVTLYTDQTPLVQFWIHEFKPNHQELPTKLFDVPNPEVTPGLPIHHVTLDGMDEMVAMNGKKFQMDRIDYTMQKGQVQIWDIYNTNGKPGMIHPYHMHGTTFKVISRDGHAPLPTETGLKDTVAINPGEHVRIKVWFDVAGVFMYHCHIIEHEDGGMMAQLKVIDPADPNKEYPLLNHMDLMMAFAKERGVDMDHLWLGGMDSYKKMGMEM